MTVVQGLPERVEIAGRVFRLTVFLVHSSYRDGIMQAPGTPRLVSLLKDSTTNDPRDGDEYFISYVPENLLRE